MWKHVGDLDDMYTYIYFFIFLNVYINVIQFVMSITFRCNTWVGFDCEDQMFGVKYK